MTMVMQSQTNVLQNAIKHLELAPQQWPFTYVIILITLLHPGAKSYIFMFRWLSYRCSLFISVSFISVRSLYKYCVILFCHRTQFILISKYKSQAPFLGSSVDYLTCITRSLCKSVVEDTQVPFYSLFVYFMHQSECQRLQSHLGIWLLCAPSFSNILDITLQPQYCVYIVDILPEP